MIWVCSFTEEFFVMLFLAGVLVGGILGFIAAYLYLLLKEA